MEKPYEIVCTHDSNEGGRKREGGREINRKVKQKEQKKKIQETIVITENDEVNYPKCLFFLSKQQRNETLNFKYNRRYAKFLC